jgi:UMF1 family MFS transporter
MALILGVQAIGAVLALVLGPRLFTVLAETLDTKRTIVLALVVYVVVAVWGFVLDSVIEFWMLAWMVAVVQGGSQALSRSLYAKLSPASKSGEFFGLFGVMEKFSAILGPLLFAGMAGVFGSSRPAILSLILLFGVGIALLSRVDVPEGVRVARAEDAKAGIRHG